MVIEPTDVRLIDKNSLTSSEAAFRSQKLELIKVLISLSAELRANSCGRLSDFLDLLLFLVLLVLVEPGLNFAYSLSVYHHYF